jgi:CDP-glycerol glycerophosphotransferase (TagB/SpsB family)
VRAAVPGLTVLHRGHPNTANRASLDEPGVVDVTLYPELADLVLAADAVVTDYSSLIVDVLASDTPLGLLVPDLEDFEERGFFADLFGSPPGPVAETTEDLLPWLTDGLTTSYDGRKRLRAELLPLDDGHAAERIVAAEFG